jgi:hypothetical protein
MIDYSILPEHMQEGMKLYIEKGIKPGHFLRAVLENNLVESFARADDINIKNMFNWADFMYNQCPEEARGSKEKVEQWIQSFERDISDNR